MKLLKSPEEIDLVIKILARNINERHLHSEEGVIIIGLLNGCFMFYSDLVREITIPVECDFMRVKSYVKKRTQGDVQITKDLETPVKGKHVYLIDDILDSGNTMKMVSEYLHVKHPRSINIVTLFKRKNHKWDPLSEPMIHTFDYGFELDEEWIVGYGCDDEHGHLRNLRGVFEI